MVGCDASSPCCVASAESAQGSMDTTDQSAAAAQTSRPRPSLGLSGKLLVLTLLFVMIAEVLIYVPSIANFRLNWLHDRLSSAYTAALVLEVTPNVPDTLTKQI